MSEKWYVYRYSLDQPILNASETELNLTPGDTSWEAEFKLSGGRLIKVEMVAEAATDAWHGKKEDLDFRWTRVVAHKAPLLIGQVFDSRQPAKRRDFFVASRSRRTIPLPEQTLYRFAGSFLTPYERIKPSEAATGHVSVDLGATPKTVTFEGKIYKILTTERFENGLKLRGRFPQDGPLEDSLCLWIPPIDGSRRLIATGYHVMEDMAHSPDEILTGAGDPHCCRGVGICPEG